MSRAVTFLYLTQEQVVECGGLDMPQTMAAVEKAFQMLDHGECIEPQAPLIHWNGIQGRRVSMHPAYIGGDVQVVGVKWIPSNPENPAKRNMPRANAIIILNDPESGFPLAVMDGTVISAMRTGAVVGVGAQYLARKDAAVVGLIGAGVINRTQLTALHVALPGLREVRLFDIAPEKARAFAEEMGAEDRYIRAEWVKAGALMANLSINDYTFDAVLASDRIVVDNKKQLQLPTAILTDMVAEELVNPDEIVELGTIVNGKALGRTSDEERIFFSPLGMGIEDLINAHRVYLEARRRGVGQALELWHDPVWT